jgi:hypothetical protein
VEFRILYNLKGYYIVTIDNRAIRLEIRNVKLTNKVLHLDNLLSGFKGYDVFSLIGGLCSYSLAL